MNNNDHKYKSFWIKLPTYMQGNLTLMTGRDKGHLSLAMKPWGWDRTVSHFEEANILFNNLRVENWSYFIPINLQSVYYSKSWNLYKNPKNPTPKPNSKIIITQNSRDESSAVWDKSSCCQIVSSWWSSLSMWSLAVQRKTGKVVLPVGAALCKSFFCPRLVLGLS